MSNSADLQSDKLLKRLLAELDSAEGSAPGEHLDDEMLALFAEGALTGAQRSAAVAHLAGCATCRNVVALLLEEEPSAVALQPKAATWFTPQVLGWAMAAALLIGFSTLYLANRDVQVGGERPAQNTLAMLDSAGRLTDYGYGLDGRLTNRFVDPFAGQAKSMEGLPEGTDLFSQLNRGERLLAWERTKDAAATFEDVIKSHPSNATAWLGKGLAAYVQGDYAAAAAAFRKASELNPSSQAARMNLAMTLEMQHQPEAALKLWKELLQGQLTDADRQKIEQQVQALESRAR